jgi:hypothetical protein
MSASPNFNSEVVKSAGYIKKNRERMYKSSFGDLPEGAIYRDPAGWKTGGEAVELQKARFEQLATEPVAELDGQAVLEKWDELQEAGFSVQETTKEIRKNLDTGDWTLPLDILPEVFTVNPERLPMADMMTRVTTQDDEVVPTALTDHPGISWGLETTDDTEGSYDYSDPTYDGDLSYPVEGFGAATRLEDKLILASSNVRSAEASQEAAFVRAMQQELERQIILGTNNNAGGFDGFDDLISNNDGDVVTDLDPDAASDSDFENATRDIIDSAEFAGAPMDSLAVVCDFDWHRRVRDSLVSRQRYDGGVTEVGSGFEAMTVDNVPVMKSHAIDRISEVADGTTNNAAYAVNMDATYLAALQEVSVKPLAKIAPQEQFAVDAYMTLVSEDNGAHIQAATVSPTA